MVDLSGGPDGPIEHGFSNTVFIIPGAIIIGLSGIQLFKDLLFILYIFLICYSCKVTTLHYGVSWYDLLELIEFVYFYLPYFIDSTGTKEYLNFMKCYVEYLCRYVIQLVINCVLTFKCSLSFLNILVFWVVQSY